jgi:hypothetical protein
VGSSQISFFVLLLIGKMGDNDERFVMSVLAPAAAGAATEVCCVWCKRETISEEIWDECMDAISDNTINPRYKLAKIERRMQPPENSTSLYNHLAFHDPVSRFPHRDCWGCRKGLFSKADFVTAGYKSMWDQGKYSCRTPKDYRELEKQHRATGPYGLQTHFEYHVWG